MSGMLHVGSIVDTQALLDMLWASLAAGIGVTTSFAVAILGATRSVDLSRNGRTGEAAVFGLMAVVAFAVVVAAVVFGIVAMTEK
jgi:hypothetical protein